MTCEWSNFGVDLCEGVCTGISPSEVLGSQRVPSQILSHYSFEDKRWLASQWPRAQAEETHTCLPESSCQWCVMVLNFQFYASPRMFRAVSYAKNPAHFPSVGKLLLFTAKACSSLGRVYSFLCREGRSSGETSVRSPWLVGISSLMHICLWSRPKSRPWPGARVPEVCLGQLQKLGTATWLPLSAAGKQNRTWMKLWFCKQAWEWKQCP